MADGTPVVESGSNSDGEWIKWGDGTMESYSSAPTSNTASSDASAPLPVVFVGFKPRIQLTLRSYSNEFQTFYEYASSTTLSRVGYAFGNAGNPHGLTVTARGRWK